MRLVAVTCSVLFTLVMHSTYAESEAVELERPSNKAALVDTAKVDTTKPKATRSGPALWKVSNRSGHVLWLLGTVNPKPKDLKWQSDAIHDVIANSQLLLRQANELPANIDVELYTLDPLQHMRAAWHEKLLADDAAEQNTPLKELLTADLYARVRALHESLHPKRSRRSDLGHLESMRPLAVANALYTAALDRNNLSNRAVIHEDVERIARRADVDIEDVTLQIRVNLKTAMQIATDRSEQPLTMEIACLQTTVEQLETQLPKMAARARAWADGDVTTLRELPTLTRDACNYAAWSAPRWQDLPQQLQQRWLDAANTALSMNRSTVALVEMSELLKPNGLLAALQSKGYQVEAP